MVSMVKVQEHASALHQNYNRLKQLAELSCQMSSLHYYSVCIFINIKKVRKDGSSDRELESLVACCLVIAAAL